MQDPIQPLEPRRLLASGAIDFSYAQDGVLDVSDVPGAVAIMPLHADAQDRLYVAVDYGSSRALARFDSAGLFDASFGTVGIAALPVDQTPTDLQINGGQFTVFYGDQLLALTSGGSVDTSRYGGDGLLPLSALPGNAQNVITDTAGNRTYDNGPFGVIGRVDANGAAVTSFGDSGTLDLRPRFQSTLPEMSFGRFDGMALRPDGSLLISGSYVGSSSAPLGSFSYVAAVDANGQPVAGFGGGDVNVTSPPTGVRIVDSSAGNVDFDQNEVTDLFVAADGSFAITTELRGDESIVPFAATAYTANGTLRFNEFFIANVNGNYSAFTADPVLTADGQLAYIGGDLPLTSDAYNFGQDSSTLPPTNLFAFVGLSDGAVTEYSEDGDGRLYSTLDFKIEAFQPNNKRLIAGKDRVFVLDNNGAALAINVDTPADVAVTYNAGVMTVSGTPFGDSLRTTTDFFLFNGERFNKADFPGLSSVVVNGKDGADSMTVVDFGAPVTVNGGNGNDTLVGLGGGDVLNGNNGADTLEANVADSAFGGAGNDTLVGFGNFFVLEGGDDDDILRSNATGGVNILRGQAGNDTLFGSDAADDFSGGSGTDTLDLSTRPDIVAFTADNLANDGPDPDNVRDDIENVLLSAPISDGRIAGVGKTLFITGTDVANVIFVSNIGTHYQVEYDGFLSYHRKVDVSRIEIAGRGGADDLRALGDVPPANISGGAGNDYILGGSGNDLLVGNDGNDTLSGATGNDTLYGGNGNDRLGGGKKNDLLFGEAGDDRLYGDDNNDTLDGGGGVDRLFGDELAGPFGNDVLIGGGSNDKLYGRGGDDTFYGGAGRDLQWGGAGTDTAYVDDEDVLDDDNLFREIEVIL